MISVRRALRVGHTLATKAAPTEVTVYRLTYASEDNPYDTTAQHTYSTHRVRGTFAPKSVDHEPIEDQGTYRGTVTLNQYVLGFVPTQSDRIEVGGVIYNIVEVHDIEGAIVKMSVRGPAADPVETGDVTGPVLTDVSASSSGAGILEWTATANEQVFHRVRYRKPPLTGSYTTTVFSVTYTLTANGDVGSLDGGQYEVEIQAKDAAGNVSRWYAAGTVTVAPDIAT